MNLYAITMLSPNGKVGDGFTTRARDEADARSIAEDHLPDGAEGWTITVTPQPQGDPA